MTQTVEFIKLEGDAASEQALPPPRLTHGQRGEPALKKETESNSDDGSQDGDQDGAAERFDVVLAVETGDDKGAQVAVAHVCGKR